MEVTWSKTLFKTQLVALFKLLQFIKISFKR